MNSKLINRKMFIAIVPWLFVFLWSTGFIGAKYTTSYSDPFYLLFMRAVGTCVVFALLAWIFRVRWPSRQAAVKQMATGFMMQTLFLGGCFSAISSGMPAAITSLIVGMQPILTALYVTFVHRQTFRPLQWLGIVLGFFGVFLVLNPAASHGYVLGFSAIIGAIIGLLGITMGTIYQKTVKVDGHTITQVFYQSASLAISMGILTLLFEEQRVQWNLNLIFGLGWLVFVVGVCATLLLMFMIKNGESTKVATYFYLVPALTAVESWLLFDQRISTTGLIGMFASIIGLLLVIRHAKPHTESKTNNSKLLEQPASE